MPMEWNDCCDFVRDVNITSVNEGGSHWRKEEVTNVPEEFNSEAVKWIKAFFDAHPWMERMMIVFDD